MSRIPSDARAAAAHAARMLRARPGLVAVFVGAQLVSNLLRLWIGAVGGSMFLYAVGGVFLFVRIFLTQWLHVATARLADDAAVPLRAAFRVTSDQATWFHGLVVVSIVAFGVRRLWLDQLAGGFFAPAGIADLSTLFGLALGFAVTYLMFLPLTPGYFAALLGPWRPGLRWSLRGIRGQLWPALATLMLLAMPVAIVRRWVFELLGQGGYVRVVGIAALDAALTVLLMLLATAVYWRTYRRALERIGPPPERAAAIPA